MDETDEASIKAEGFPASSEHLLDVVAAESESIKTEYSKIDEIQIHSDTTNGDAFKVESAADSTVVKHPIEAVISNQQLVTITSSHSAIMDSISLSDDEEKESGQMVEGVEPVIAQNEEMVPEKETTPSYLLERIRELKEEKDKLQAEAEERSIRLANLETECSSLKDQLAKSEADHKTEMAEQEKKFHQLSEEMGNKNAELKKYFIAANKEKESMVVKYAMGEKEILVQRRGKEEAEKKLQVATKEKDDALSKLKTMTAERNRLQQVGDSRYQEIVVLKKDVEKWKEECKIQETKASVAAGRHKAEVDAHQNTRTSLEATIKQLTETRQEIEKTRNECQDFMRKFRDEEDARNRKLENTAKEERVKLMIDEAAASELETLRLKYKSVVEENNLLSVKIQKFEKERLDYDANLAKLKETVESQKQEIVDLMAQVAEMESLRLQLQRVEERSEERSAEVERLRAEATELLADMAACRRKEAELLEFTQKLTDKNVTLQSDLACLDAKTSALESEHRRISSKLTECEKQLATTKFELETEKKKRKDETEILAKKLAELSKQVEVSHQKAIDAENEVLVLKRRHTASLRELTKELQNCKKQLESQTVESSSRTCRASPLSQSSRTSSNSSLNRVVGNGNSQTGNAALTPASDDSDNNNFRLSNNQLTVPSSYSNGLHEVEPKESFHDPSFQVPESHMLVEKIVKLQRNLARKQEKLEFMEDHISTMVEELKKKNRLLQHYILQEESGALSSASMDENKARASAHGGIMASLYSSKQSDSGLTLDLSLEINQKLQAVLEDTLLKNITLKENINTLGQEIALLSTNRSSKK